MGICVAQFSLFATRNMFVRLFLRSWRANVLVDSIGHGLFGLPAMLWFLLTANEAAWSGRIRRFGAPLDTPRVTVSGCEMPSLYPMPDHNTNHSNMDNLNTLISDPRYHDILAILKGARNGLVYGAKIRFPHALVMTLIFQGDRS